MERSASQLLSVDLHAHTGQGSSSVTLNSVLLKRSTGLPTLALEGTSCLVIAFSADFVYFSGVKGMLTFLAPVIGLISGSALTILTLIVPGIKDFLLYFFNNGVAVI
jgi:hypothetical protein